MLLQRVNCQSWSNVGVELLEDQSAQYSHLKTHCFNGMLGISSLCRGQTAWFFSCHIVRVGEHKAIKSCCGFQKHGRPQGWNWLHLKTDDDDDDEGRADTHQSTQTSVRVLLFVLLSMTNGTLAWCLSLLLLSNIIFLQTVVVAPPLQWFFFVAQPTFVTPKLQTGQNQPHYEHILNSP